METGASSACFYPMETEKAFLRIAQLGFTRSEIFFNSPSELGMPFIKELAAIRDAYGIDVTSLHPFCSFAEGYNLFSSYERRFYDATESFRRYFEAAAVLGAEYIVLHGSKEKLEISPGQYAERLGKLNEIATGFGCTVAHENVAKYMSASVQFMKTVRSFLGDSFKMVLDVKQARRAGVDPCEFINELGDSIVHVHLSDCDKEHDCLPPCEKGLFDFEELFTQLERIGYSGRYIVELYSDNYSDESEILRSAKYLDGILNKVRKL